MRSAHSSRFSAHLLRLAGLFVLSMHSPGAGESGARARLAFRILAPVAVDSVAVSLPQTRASSASAVDVSTGGRGRLLLASVDVAFDETLNERSSLLRRSQGVLPQGCGNGRSP
jgi:hypothetical protein